MLSAKASWAWKIGQTSQNSFFRYHYFFSSFSGACNSCHSSRGQSKSLARRLNNGCISSDNFRQPFGLYRSSVLLKIDSHVSNLSKTCRFLTGSKWHANSTTGSPGFDKSPNDKGEVVYIGTMSRFVRFVKLFSLSTSIIGISLQPLIYNQVADLHWALALTAGGMASFFVFITPLLLHLVSKRYVTQMRWNPQTGQFNATTYSFLLRDLEHSFSAKQVTIPTTPHLFTTILINEGKKPLFIDPSLFLNRQALIHLLKFNEPLEWELPSEHEKPSSYWDDGEGAEKSSTREMEGEKGEDKSLKKMAKQQK